MKISDRSARLIKCAVLLLLAVCLVMPGCAKAPRDEVESLEALKQEFVDAPHVLFPDLSRFEAVNPKYEVNYQDSRRLQPDNRPSFGCSKMVNTSYNIGLAPDIKYDNSELISVSIYGQDLTKYEWTPFVAGSEYRGLRFRMDSDEMPETFYEQSDSWGGVPLVEGSYVHYYNYAFELEQCRYTIDADLLLQPDELKNTSLEAEIEKGHKELLAVSDTIIDQVQGSEAQ